MKLSEKGIETIFSALRKTIEERDLVFRRISQGVFKKHIEALEFESDDFEMATTPNTNKINWLDVKTEDLPTTPKDVHLTLEEAKILLGIARHKQLLTEREVVEIVKLILRIEQVEAQNDY